MNKKVFKLKVDPNNKFKFVLVEHNPSDKFQFEKEKHFKPKTRNEKELVEIVKVLAMTNQIYESKLRRFNKAVKNLQID